MQGGSIKFHLTAGRIYLDGSRLMNMSNAGNGIERLNVVVKDNSYSFSYQRSDGKASVSVSADDSDRFSICREEPSDRGTTKTTFVQEPSQGVTLTVAAGSTAVKTYSAPSLWHLFIFRPREAKTYLAPLLEIIRPNGKLGEQAAAVEAELIRKANSNTDDEQSRWRELVEQLGDDRYAKREAAERELRACSPAVLSYLRSLNFSQIEAERRYRLVRTIDSFAGRLSDDSPERIASWLVGDASIWLALTERTDEKVRDAAVKRVAALLGEKVTLDPSADPATQNSEREKLRLRVARLSGASERE